jgi:RNA-binding protein MEX3
MCCEGEMVAALVPCGHKLFCMDCAQRLVPKESSAESDSPSSAGGECPVCHQSVTQAIRIFS